jgi:prevent-host-death family protein
MCYTGAMTAVGLRELRQDASELVRRVESGEEIEITVAGRLAARLVPAAPRRWQRWTDIADLFTGRPDPEWGTDRDLIDQSFVNPWEPRDEGVA